MRISPAFTLVEIFLVVSILGLLAVASYTPLVQSRNNQNLKVTGETLADNIRRAHIFSRELKSQKVWGIIRVSPTEYALVSAPPQSEVVAEVKQPLPPSAHAVEQSFSLESTVVFSHNFPPIWFIQGTGGTYDQYEIKLKNANQVEMRVTIFPTGLVEIYPA